MASYYSIPRHFYMLCLLSSLLLLLGGQVAPGDGNGADGASDGCGGDGNDCNTSCRGDCYGGVSLGVSLALVGTPHHRHGSPMPMKLPMLICLCQACY